MDWNTIVSFGRSFKIRIFRCVHSMTFIRLLGNLKSKSASFLTITIGRNGLQNFNLSFPYSFSIICSEIVELAVFVFICWFVDLCVCTLITILSLQTVHVINIYACGWLFLMVFHASCVNVHYEFSLVNDIANRSGYSLLNPLPSCHAENIALHVYKACSFVIKYLGFVIQISTVAWTEANEISYQRVNK